MPDNNWKDDLTKKQERLELIAFGCNLHARKRLKETLTKEKINTFQFVEYFMDKPIGSKLDEKIRVLAEVEEDRNTDADTRPKRVLFFPFLKRLLFEFPFYPDPNAVFDGINLKSNAGRMRWPRGMKFSAKQQIDENICREPFWIPQFQAPVGQEILNSFTPYVDQVKMEWFKTCCPNYHSRIQNKWWKEEVWQRIVSNLGESGAKNSRTQVLEYNLTAWLWEHSCSKSMPRVIAAPITAGQVIYGYFILIYPQVIQVNGQLDKVKSSKLHDELLNVLFDLSHDMYAPVLALFQHSSWEKEIKEDISKIKEVQESAKAIWGSSKDELERGLYKLWYKRCRIMQSVPNDGTYIKENLVFANKNYSSPGMLKIVLKIIRFAKQLRKPADYASELPCALIFGEPGSGKESVAKLITIFSPYFGRKILSVNMAALKPNALVGPQILGSKPHFEFGGNHYEGSLSGLLTRGSQNGKMKIKRVYILDELNSLDIDLQGILLRILEQGQVTPMFDILPVDVKHLIIGIVNENPEESIREGELRTLHELEEFFGKMFRAFLHDAIARGRRLRPDLFYRMSRSLYVEVPSLHRRREDIPIIFHDICEKELEHMNKKLHMTIDFEAFEELMSSKYVWPGNIRELQSVAKIIISIVLKDDPDEYVRIRYQDVRQALGKYYKDGEMIDVQNYDLS